MKRYFIFFLMQWIWVSALNAQLLEEHSDGSDGPTISSDIRESYQFHRQVVLEGVLTNMELNDAQVKYRLSFPEHGKWFAVELVEREGELAEPAFAIFDLERYHMVGLTATMGFVMGFEPELAAELNAMHTGAEIYNQSGSSEDIMGYTAHEFTIHHDSFSGSIFIAPQSNLRIGFAMKAITLLNPHFYFPHHLPENFPDGAVLQADVRDQEGNHIRWTATSEAPASRIISTKSFNRMNIPE